MRKKVVGVMGAGESASDREQAMAHQLGRLIAQSGWVTLCGGRPSGVMRAVAEGAKSAEGLTVGVLQGTSPDDADPAIDLALCTDLGNGRNNVNVLSSDVVIACGMGSGTASEVALALKSLRPTILLDQEQLAQDFFAAIAERSPKQPELLSFAANPEEAIRIAQTYLSRPN